jgi:uncharacterized phiE125 gp8 family phage protein
MDLRRISAPLTREQKLTVVSIADVKLQARVRHDDEDELIAANIATAYDYLSGYDGWTNGFVLLEESFEFYSESLSDTLELPLRPVGEGGLISVESRDTSTADYLALDPATYTFAFDGDLGLIARLQPSLAAPTVFLPDRRRYRVRFKAGHPNPLTIPESIKKAIVLLAAHYYANREAASPDTRAGVLPERIAYGVQSLAGRYRFSPDHS